MSRKSSVRILHLYVLVEMVELGFEFGVGHKERKHCWPC
jgi:hypothetical protein